MTKVLRLLTALFLGILLTIFVVSASLASATATSGYASVIVLLAIYSMMTLFVYCLIS